MKIYIKIVLFLMLPMLISAQISIINDGAIIKINNGTDVRANNGSITNQNSGQISNNGNLYLDLDFNQNTSAIYLGGITSWLWFEGGSNQNISGDASLNIARLRVDNGNRLILGNSVNISNDVDLTNNGNVELGSNNLVLASGASLVNYDATNYVITNGMGVMQQEVAGVPVFFPVGNSSYSPLTLTNLGLVDNFQLRVEDQVWSQGTTGVLETSKIVNRTWHLDEEVAGGSLADITVQWATADELVAFDRLNCAVSHWDGSFWDHTMSYTNATNVAVGTWSQTRSGQTTFSPFAVEDASTDLPIELLSFDAKRQDINQVQLDWITTQEINNAGFELQRMLDSETIFSKITWVNGAGTTSLEQHYEWLDENPHPGISYYRLKQIDDDGSFSYSPIRAVEGIAFQSDIVLLPNPTSDVINVRFGVVSATSVRIKIYAADGKLVLDKEVALQSNQLISLPETIDFPAGSYMLQAILDNGSNKTMKFVKNTF